MKAEKLSATEKVARDMIEQELCGDLSLRCCQLFSGPKEPGCCILDAVVNYMTAIAQPKYEQRGREAPFLRFPALAESFIYSLAILLFVKDHTAEWRNEGFAAFGAAHLLVTNCRLDKVATAFSVIVGISPHNESRIVTGILGHLAALTAEAGRPIKCSTGCRDCTNSKSHLVTARYVALRICLSVLFMATPRLVRRLMSRSNGNKDIVTRLHELCRQFARGDRHESWAILNIMTACTGALADHTSEYRVAPIDFRQLLDDGLAETFSRLATVQHNRIAGSFEIQDSQLIVDEFIRIVKTDPSLHQATADAFRPLLTPMVCYLERHERGASFDPVPDVLRLANELSLPDPTIPRCGVCSKTEGKMLRCAKCRWCYCACSRRRSLTVRLLHPVPACGLAYASLALSSAPHWQAKGMTTQPRRYHPCRSTS